MFKKTFKKKTLNKNEVIELKSFFTLQNEIYKKYPLRKITVNIIKVCIRDDNLK